MTALFKLLMAVYSFNTIDYQCLTEAVYYEAGNQSLAGKISVAQVIKNRVEDRRWPNKFCKVIRQPNQFAYYWDGKTEKLPKYNNRLERFALFESKVVSFVVMLTDIDITNGSLYYHNTKIKPPKWTTKMNAVAQVGDHILYTD